MQVEDEKATPTLKRGGDGIGSGAKDCREDSGEEAS